MRILLFTQAVDQNDPILGFFHRWIEVFAEHCESVTVICLREGEHHLPSHVRVLSLGKEHGNSRLQYIVLFYRYLWQLRGSYDAVFVHMNQIYVILGGWIWRLKKIPVGLWYCHKHTPFSLRAAIPFLQKLFTQMDESTTAKTEKKCVVGHGIDIHLFERDMTNGKPANQPLQFAMVGRITPVKNLDTLVEALQITKNALPPFQVLLIGEPISETDQSYAQQLKQRIRAYDLEKEVIFTGSKSRVELKNILQKTDLVINLTKTDSFDKALLESWAMGIPVLAANTSAKRALEAEELPLCFFAPPDDPTVISQRLIECIKVLQDTNQEERMRTRLSEHVRREHNLEKLIPRIIDGLMAV